MKTPSTGINTPAAMNAPAGTSPAGPEAPKVRPAHRQAQDRKGMLDRAIGLVERARRNGTVLDIDAETENLLHENPNCLMSFTELRADFETVASVARLI